MSDSVRRGLLALAAGVVIGRVGALAGFGFFGRAALAAVLATLFYFAFAPDLDLEGAEDPGVDETVVIK